jgi:hypothetical protein
MSGISSPNPQFRSLFMSIWIKSEEDEKDICALLQKTPAGSELFRVCPPDALTKGLMHFAWGISG